MFLDDQVARGLARAEPRQYGLLLEILGDGVKGRVNGSCVQFHPHELLARGQIFNGYVHNKNELNEPRRIPEQWSLRQCDLRFLLACERIKSAVFGWDTFHNSWRTCNRAQLTAAITPRWLAVSQT
jgi:hypothetical protein